MPSFSFLKCRYPNAERNICLNLIFFFLWWTKRDCAKTKTKILFTQMISLKISQHLNRLFPQNNNHFSFRNALRITWRPRQRFLFWTWPTTTAACSSNRHVCSILFTTSSVRQNAFLFDQRSRQMCKRRLRRRKLICPKKWCGRLLIFEFRSEILFPFF